MVSSISGSSDYLAYLLEKLAASTTATSTTTSASKSAAPSGPLSASEMFDKLTKDLGGDGTTITKDQLDSYISKVESDTTGTYDKGSLGFLNQLSDNWDSISGGDDSITASELQAGMSYLQPPSMGGSTDKDLFSALLDAVDSNEDGTVSLTDLTSYLKSLRESDTSATADSTTASSSTSDTELANEIKFIKDLIDNFEEFASDSGTITSNSFYSTLKAPQDPSTVTADQLVSPIDLKV